MARLIRGASLILFTLELGAAPPKPELRTERHPLRWFLLRVDFNLPAAGLSAYFPFEPVLSRQGDLQIVASYNPPAEMLAPIGGVPHPYSAREVDACNFQPPWVFAYRHGRMFSARFASEREIRLEDAALPRQPDATFLPHPNYLLAAWRVSGGRLLVAFGWNAARHTAREFLMTEPAGLAILFPELARGSGLLPSRENDEGFLAGSATH